MVTLMEPHAATTIQSNQPTNENGRRVPQRFVSVLQKSCARKVMSIYQAVLIVSYCIPNEFKFLPAANLNRICVQRTHSNICRTRNTIQLSLKAIPLHHCLDDYGADTQLTVIRYYNDTSETQSRANLTIILSKGLGRT